MEVCLLMDDLVFFFYLKMLFPISSSFYFADIRDFFKNSVVRPLSITCSYMFRKDEQCPCSYFYMIKTVPRMSGSVLQHS